MDSQLGGELKRQIQAYMKKKPTSEVKEVARWLRNENHLLAGTQINPKTLGSFISYQVKKFLAGNEKLLLK